MSEDLFAWIVIILCLAVVVGYATLWGYAWLIPEIKDLRRRRERRRHPVQVNLGDESLRAAAAMREMQEQVHRMSRILVEVGITVSEQDQAVLWESWR